MKYATLGSSGCIVSQFALGTMTFGAETPRAEAFAQLDAYAEAGGTFIDTADVYAAGESERIVGAWLSDRPSDLTDSMVVLTKGNFALTGQLGASGTHRRHLRRALEGSLRRLGRDHVDVYMVHSWDPLTPIEETMRFLHDQVGVERITYPAISNYLGWQIQKMVATCREHRLTVPVVLEPNYNLLAREIEWEIVPSALDAGLGLLPWSPLAGGWLTGKYTRDNRPNGHTRLGEDPGRGNEAYDNWAGKESTWAVIAEVRRVADELQMPMAQVALAWVRQRPGVASVVLGARTVDQLCANLSAADLDLPPTAVQSLTARSEPQSGPWPYGLQGQQQRHREAPRA